MTTSVDELDAFCLSHNNGEMIAASIFIDLLIYLYFFRLFLFLFFFCVLNPREYIDESIFKSRGPIVRV